MLNINNFNDRLQMMNYHRAKDMLNLLQFFPELSPVRNLTIVESIEDYNANYEFCKNFLNQRNDTLITKPSVKSIEVAESNPLVVRDTFKKLKKMDKDGVMVLFDVNCKYSERYERYAGISVRVDLGECVYIEAVSKGFDGREVSKGICVHERYYIPWFDLRKLCIKNFKNYRTYLISQEEYEKTRNERIAYLESLKVDANLLASSIPKVYQEIPDFIWLDIITNLLKKLEKNEDILQKSGFTNFAISGHTEGKHFAPWQMFDKKRYELAHRK